MLLSPARPSPFNIPPHHDDSTTMHFTRHETRDMRHDILLTARFSETIVKHNLQSSNLEPFHRPARARQTAGKHHITFLDTHSVRFSISISISLKQSQINQNLRSQISDMRERERQSKNIYLSQISLLHSMLHTLTPLID